MSAIWTTLKKWFGPSPGSVFGYLNVSEFLKIVMTAVFSGGGVAAILVALQGAAAAIFPPADAALAAALFTFLAEAWRRFHHGVTPPASLVGHVQTPLPV